MPSSTSDLKKFAQSARRSLREQVAARLDQVLRTDSAALRERDAARRELTQQIAETSKKAVIDRVAYTWFNRFCALRFMDTNRYNRIGVVSPAEGFTQPEILQEAKNGYIDEDLHKFVDCPAVFDLLGGRKPSPDPQQEAYRMLLVGACNALNRAMPFLFEPISDYTELLMPQDLLSEHSILHELREAMTPDTCQDVEVIGWLYQFYISERKDEVFEALKQNQKIAPEDIPAATQLFTPHWIVRYLVENSLGRLWMLNRPASRLVEKMDYYIKPEEPETDFLRIASPEEIKVCDPACGSGHMLTYAFDLLYSIYEEEGYPAADIPRLIMEKNLYGIEIDERAGDLAAFALVMKARGRDRRFFSRGIQPNICVLENITFTDQELKEYAAAMGRDLFTEPLLQTLKQFEQAKNFGSLIRPMQTDASFVHAELERKGLGGSIFLYGTHEKVLRALEQANNLSPRYHVVVANPPYMGYGGMNDDLKDYANNIYPDSRVDLYSMFMERNLEMVTLNGFVGMITMQTWMVLSSFLSLRRIILDKKTIVTMAHFGAHAFDTIGGEIVSTVAFILKNRTDENKPGIYLRLIDGKSEEEKQKVLLANASPSSSGFKSQRYIASQIDFKRMPDSIIAYWVSNRVRDIFNSFTTLETYASIGKGLDTGDNNKFLRYWFEVAQKTSKWFPCQKGGPYRKWYGNHDYVINWQNNGEDLKRFPGANLRNSHNYLKPGLTWTRVSSKPSFRSFPEGFIFESTGPCIFPYQVSLEAVAALLNSKLTSVFLKIIAPSMDFQSGHVCKIPVVSSILEDSRINATSKSCIDISKKDWDSYEFSSDFLTFPLLNLGDQKRTLGASYNEFRDRLNQIIYKMQQLEEENNRILIDAYGLHNELTPNIPLDEVTLTCNPHYRYGGNRSEAELEALLLADTMREFISYAVGCMFGRYSLDRPGLFLANQGETLQDYIRKVYGGEAPPPNAFLPDEDNAIPVLEGEWFSDDITERFKKFLRITFGAQHYEENLTFIENAIGRDIRSYFLKEFYSQHVKMYQKRPIYWMFSSPRGSFNVLIYMHRYQPDTLSVILNRYLREFRGKLEGRKAHLEQVSISASSSQREKTAALKEIEGLNKTLEEIRAYERDVLYPLAVQGIQIDLDDGVKVNYKKFGKALAKVTGLSE